MSLRESVSKNDPLPSIIYVLLCCPSLPHNVFFLCTGTGIWQMSLKQFAAATPQSIHFVSLMLLLSDQKNFGYIGTPDQKSKHAKNCKSFISHISGWCEQKLTKFQTYAVKSNTGSALELETFGSLCEQQNMKLRFLAPISAAEVVKT